MCEGPDLNRGTPSRTDLESVAFDRAWLPSLEGLVNVENIIKILRVKMNKRKASFVLLAFAAMNIALLFFTYGGPSG
jgi:hypothetical protein